jgi:hypothetical protein
VTNAQAAGEFGFDGRNFLTQNEPRENTRAIAASISVR